MLLRLILNALPTRASETKKDENSAPEQFTPEPEKVDEPKEASPEKSPNVENEKNIETEAMNAPVSHLANDQKNLLVDVPFGSGKIVFLTDPYIVSNGGINLVDNAQFMTNIVTSREGIIAFDEFHQGYGAENNSLLGYFEGTPLTAMTLQLFALIGIILYTQSRRFARPLPEKET